MNLRKADTSEIDQQTKTTWNQVKYTSLKTVLYDSTLNYYVTLNLIKMFNLVNVTVDSVLFMAYLMNEHAFGNGKGIFWVVSSYEIHRYTRNLRRCELLWFKNKRSVFTSTFYKILYKKTSSPWIRLASGKYKGNRVTKNNHFTHTETAQLRVSSKF